MTQISILHTTQWRVAIRLQTIENRQRVEWQELQCYTNSGYSIHHSTGHKADIITNKEIKEWQQTQLQSSVNICKANLYSKTAHCTTNSYMFTWPLSHDCHKTNTEEKSNISTTQCRDQDKTSTAMRQQTRQNLKDKDRNIGSGGARSLFLLGHMWGTVTTEGHDGHGSQQKPRCYPPPEFFFWKFAFKIHLVHEDQKVVLCTAGTVKWEKLVLHKGRNPLGELVGN